MIRLHLTVKCYIRIKIQIILGNPIDCMNNNFSLFQQDCEYDSLALSSKLGSGEIRKHGVFCGSRLPPVITSEGNSLRLEFLSDNSVQKSGFAAVFFTGKVLFD